MEDFFFNLEIFFQIQEIKYDVDDFIENSDQPDYSVNADLFEELELDKYDSASARKFTFINFTVVNLFENRYN